MATRTALSKALASADVWKVRPNLWSPARQWWKVGMTLAVNREEREVRPNRTRRHERREVEEDVRRY